MAIPRVFISSTCYDLRHIRESLKYFVKTIGYEPILSEEGAVFYNPNLHTHDSCISEVPNCQIFVLIIGGRYGGTFKEGDDSITNIEYREAVKNKIPVFALVEQAVYSDHHVYITNKKNKKVDENQITYPSSDNTKIFSFIDEVRSNSINNAIVPFRDFSDIESYLRQQWAGMMFSFLSSKNEESRVADMMSHLVGVSEKIEFLSSQVLNSVGSKESQVMAKLYDQMLNNAAIKALLSCGYKPSLASIFKSNTLMECSALLGKHSLIVCDTDEFMSTGSGEIESHYYESMEKSYKKLKDTIDKILKEHNLKIKDVLASLEVNT